MQNLDSAFFKANNFRLVSDTLYDSYNRVILHLNTLVAECIEFNFRFDLVTIFVFVALLVSSVKDNSIIYKLAPIVAPKHQNLIPVDLAYNWVAPRSQDSLCNAQQSPLGWCLHLNLFDRAHH